MNEKEAIEKLNNILEEWQKILDIEDKVDREIEMSMYFEDMPFIEIQTVLQALKYKDNRIDELEKALIDEDLKNKTKIEELESELYNANCIIDDYIEERNRLKDRLKKDIKNNKSGINFMDLRCIGKWQEAKEILDILEE